MRPEDIERFCIMLLAGRAPAEIIEEFFAGESAFCIERHTLWLENTWRRYQELCANGVLPPLESLQAVSNARKH